MLTRGAFIVAVCLAFVAAEQVQFQYCSTRGQEQCEISDVHIDPCAEAEKNEPCKLKLGKSAGISFKYKANWDQGENDLKTRAYWASVLDIPFLGMKTDGCSMTSCPVKKDQLGQYNFTLDISDKFLPKRYNVKFKLWEDNVEDHACCLLVKLKLV
ncbi:mite group 2 allergen Tyr p 2-like [Cimex lectularius]|uniref:MD-2-related lipid-recognition domain-containing protein n=1 Tax=Cimex lectularius TaxID=79782 RepID=A0A8I6R6P6_CIMLE|nr:mite group 2 allergen Tyr p 2-like [Cimex lectularius]